MSSEVWTFLGVTLFFLGYCQRILIERQINDRPRKKKEKRKRE